MACKESKEPIEGPVEELVRSEDAVSLPGIPVLVQVAVASMRCPNLGELEIQLELKPMALKDLPQQVSISSLNFFWLQKRDHMHPLNAPAIAFTLIWGNTYVGTAKCRTSESFSKKKDWKLCVELNQRLLLEVKPAPTRFHSSIKRKAPDDAEGSQTEEEIQNQKTTWKALESCIKECVAGEVDEESQRRIYISSDTATLVRFLLSNIHSHFAWSDLIELNGDEDGGAFFRLFPLFSVYVQPRIPRIALYSVGKLEPVYFEPTEEAAVLAHIYCLAPTYTLTYSYKGHDRALSFPLQTLGGTTFKDVAAFQRQASAPQTSRLVLRTKGIDFILDQQNDRIEHENSKFTAVKVAVNAREEFFPWIARIELVE